MTSLTQMDIQNENRPRAVFSTADFALIRDALACYLKHGDEGARDGRASHLYHRLGRLAD